MGNQFLMREKQKGFCYCTPISDGLFIGPGTSSKVPRDDAALLGMFSFAHVNVPAACGHACYARARVCLCIWMY